MSTQNHSISEETLGRLLIWYDAFHRDLPWRRDPSPYHVWISEIMLQQTRVEAVKPYYARFLRSLPDIPALAHCPEEQLLKLWEGLGYYNRVRNLQKAAIVLCEEYGGALPDTYEALLKLPGIGAYTAGAIASICFGRPVPAVDGNVLRILSRLRADERLISEEKVREAVRGELLAVMPKDSPGDLNQAMMELGATVCVPNGAPACGECPWREECRAHLLGAEGVYPRKGAKAGRKTEDLTVLVLQDADRIALHKRPAKGLLAGLYELPNLPGHLSGEEVRSYLDSQGLKVVRITRLPEAKHIFTHKEWHMIGYRVRVDELERGPKGTDSCAWIYVAPEETLSGYPIPSAFESYAGAFGLRRRAHSEK
ncbi:MAG: A/G-specific adenine glycosylase [Lachnospiraceae bacterium]|nr:A/G-specific adenine glycosylase [Lachnospiraceae bacterium]